MRADGWHFTDDVDEFLAEAGEFLRARPVPHIMALTWTARLRARGTGPYGGGRPLLGRLTRAGSVRGACHQLPGRSLGLTPLTAEQAGSLAAHLAAAGHALPGTGGDHDTTTAFATAWQRHTGAAPTPAVRLRLRRLAALTPPQPAPAGQARAAGEADRDQLMDFCRGFAADVREDVAIDAVTWPTTRYADKDYTFWEAPDGTPVSMAGINPTVAGLAQVDPVYTPAAHRGRGYAAGVTAAVTRAALAAGATEVTLFTDATNPTSNALYQRLGYDVYADWTTYTFA
ncbi:GNAT family N-acetyltransferase [Streptomyces aculeolatus]|uniref:GNAT family N-acetyltransferase n=1 Tax=Streptomyces aculeolatus TaxID=270689 RepID=UPI001CECD187|nr:GNAT family N-acetyltransferase [Streptomyces aculeolatus]